MGSAATGEPIREGNNLAEEILPNLRERIPPLDDAGLIARTRKC
jgi:hypothetical protein